MITFDIDIEARLIVSRAKGRIGVLDIADFLQALVRDPRFAPTFDSLIVATDAESIPPPSMLRFLNPLLDAWSAKRGRAMWAFVLPGAAQVQEVERHLARLKLNQVQVRCFVEERDARAWLGRLE